MTASFRRRGRSIVARFTVAEAGVLRRVVEETAALLGDTAEPPMPGESGQLSDTGEPGDPLEALAGLDERPPQPPDDPVLARLLPDGYRDDPEASAELRRLTESSLRAIKIDQARRLLAELPERGGSVALDEERAEAWLGAINDVRLALGTRLEVTEETDVSAAVRADPPSEDAYRYAIYDWLTWLQDTLVLALAGGR